MLTKTLALRSFIKTITHKTAINIAIHVAAYETSSRIIWNASLHSGGQRQKKWSQFVNSNYLDWNRALSHNVCGVSLVTQCNGTQWPHQRSFRAKIGLLFDNFHSIFRHNLLISANLQLLNIFSAISWKTHRVSANSSNFGRISAISWPHPYAVIRTFCPNKPNSWIRPWVPVGCQWSDSWGLGWGKKGPF